MFRLKIFILSLALLCLASSVSAKCSFGQRIFACNAAAKAAFGVAFAAASAAPAVGCKTMSAAQWESVGCDSPSSHRHTKICAPAKWSRVLKLFATAMALKTKILVKSPYTMSKLFNTSSGRSLIRHELAHIRQQSGISAYRFGYRYLDGWCDAGCSYSKNRYEVDARKYENDNC